MPDVPDDHLVLVLYGDVPLLRAATLRAAGRARLGPAQLALLTVNAARPHRLRPRGARRARPREGDRRAQGREARAAADPRGQHRRARAAREACCAAGSAGCAATMRRASTTSPTSSRWPCAMDCAVAALAAQDETEVLGVNDRAAAGAAGRRAARRACAAALMRVGATLADPARFDQRGELVVGRDVFIDVNVVFEGRVVLGRSRAHRPELRAARRRRSARTPWCNAHSVLEQCDGGPGLHHRVRSRGCARARRSAPACTSAISSR